MKKHSKQPVASIEARASMYEYLLVISPSEELKKDVIEIKTALIKKLITIKKGIIF